MKLHGYFQEVLDPLDFEDFLCQHKNIIEHDFLWRVFKFPLDDLSISILPHKCRNSTVKDVKDCLINYTSDWVQICRKYKCFNMVTTLKQKQNLLWELIETFPIHIYEIDIENNSNEKSKIISNIQQLENQDPERSLTTDPLVLPVLDHNNHNENQDRINESLRNQDRPDTYFEYYFQHLGVDALEPRFNGPLPTEHSGHKIMFRCLNLNFNIDIEPIFVSASLYDLNLKKKNFESDAFLVKPQTTIFACGKKLRKIRCKSFSTFRAMVKKLNAISENFHFDMNGENLNKLMSRHANNPSTRDACTRGNCGIFHLTFPSPDLYLVMKFEKVLQQGEISDVVEPYVKLEEKNREKVKSNAKYWCEHRGQYRMPFAWTAINLTNLIAGSKPASSTSLERGLSLEKDKNSKSNFSLDKLTSDTTKAKLSSPQPSNYYFSSPFIHGGNACRQRGSLPRDLMTSPNIESLEAFNRNDTTLESTLPCCCHFCSVPLAGLDYAYRNFKPFTTTVTSLFKQESDKISDEDLYKNLLDIKKANAVALKKSRCIPVTMKLEFLPCPSSVRNCMSPQGHYLEDDPTQRGPNSPDTTLYPIREILEFPSQPIYNPNQSYRNLLYLYPKRVNFASRTGSSRNIAVKIEILNGEGKESVLQSIFGQSNGPQFVKETHTTVLYHNKMPDFYNEVKINLPAEVGDNLHLFFTFYHVSCQALKSHASASALITSPLDATDNGSNGSQQSLSETIIGYTWLPLMRDTRLRTGDHSLPICLDHPPPVYSNIDAEVALPGIRWLDNHKNLFDITLKLSSTLYSEDPYLNQFLHTTRWLEDERENNNQNYHALPGRNFVGHERGRAGAGQKRLKQCLIELKEVPVPELVPFVYVVLDKLIAYLTRPLLLDGQQINLAPVVFECLACLMTKLREHQAQIQSSHACHDTINSSNPGAQTNFTTLMVQGKNASSQPCSEINDNSTFALEERPARFRPIEMVLSYLHNHRLTMPIYCDDDDTTLDELVLSPGKDCSTNKSFQYFWGVKPQVSNNAPLDTFSTKCSIKSDKGSYGTLGRKRNSRAINSTVTNSMSLHVRSTSDPDIQPDMSECSLSKSPTLRKRFLHEECCLQFVVSSGTIRENALANAWFFFELIYKSMVEYLAEHDKLSQRSRKKLFSESFVDDVASLFNIAVSDIIVRYAKDIKFAKDLNTSLAYFTYDMLTVMDVGFVMNLIKSYYKQVSTKIQTSPDPVHLMSLKLDFMEILSEHEHFLSVNLPFQVFWVTTHPATNSGTEMSGKNTIARASINSPVPKGETGLMFVDDQGNARASALPSSEGSEMGDLKDNSATDLIPSDFKRQHYLVGLLLTELMGLLETRYSQFHNRAIYNMAKSLAAHDCDQRYDNGNPSSLPNNVKIGVNNSLDSRQIVLAKGMGKIVKTRIASLYFPLLGIIVDSVTQFCDNFFQIAASNTYKSGAGGSNRNSMANEYDSYNSPLSSIFFSSSARQSLTEEMFDQHFAVKRTPLSYEATKHLLSCFVWLLKNIDKTLLKHWWSELSMVYLAQFLEVLYMVTKFFEYKGKNAVKNLVSSGTKSAEGIKSRLEDAILGTLNARSDMMARRKGNSLVATDNGHQMYGDHKFGHSELAMTSISNSPGPDIYATLTHQSSSHHAIIPGGGDGGGGGKLRWKKDFWRSSLNYESSATSISSSHTNQWTSGGAPYKSLDVGQKLALERSLCAETSLVALDILELFVQFIISDDIMYKPLVIGVMRILLNLFSCNQSVQVLENLFATQRSIVSKFPDLFFEEETEMCADICKKLLQHACSTISTVRAQASASLYHLMCRNFEQGNNFALVKMKVTMSLSTLVGTNQVFDEIHLQRSLQTILKLSDQDAHMQGTTFPLQVKKLVSNMNMILSDTVKMKEYQEDHEMLIDLMYRIANGYHNSPDLRLTWLQNMAAKHSQRSNHSEAAQCLVHSAAMVTEYLQLMEDRLYLPKGAVSYIAISENIFEESVISDDNIVALHEEGMFGSKYFSEYGLIGLLEQAASSCNMAGEYEAINLIYKLILPIHEHYNDYKKLASIHGKLHEIYNKIIHQEGKRVNFGTYFRVGFYGSRFMDLDREEYIYKEPAITKLSEINNRLLAFYGEKFGEHMVESIKDSNQVDPSALDPDKAYIQITYVEAYFDLAEEASKTTPFEKNYNIRRFMYATPFTRDGRSHGLLQEQCKRKTILTTENSFPYLKTRVKVIDREQFVLNPIEVAVEDLQKKTKELLEATCQEPPDLKILAMVLQGCLGPTVNQGPLEVANVFLKEVVEGKIRPTIHHNKLRLCFKDFMRRCRDALIRNKGLCHVEQREYQKQIEANYQTLSSKLNPFINNRVTLNYVKYAMGEEE